MLYHQITGLGEQKVALHQLQSIIHLRQRNDISDSEFDAAAVALGVLPSNLQELRDLVALVGQGGRYNGNNKTLDSIFMLFDYGGIPGFQTNADWDAWVDPNQNPNIPI